MASFPAFRAMTMGLLLGLTFFASAPVSAQLPPVKPYFSVALANHAIVVSGSYDRTRHSFLAMKVFDWVEETGRDYPVLRLEMPADDETTAIEYAAFIEAASWRFPDLLIEFSSKCGAPCDAIMDAKPPAETVEAVERILEEQRRLGERMRQDRIERESIFTGNTGDNPGPARVVEILRKMSLK